jgi:hypothetical protein
MEASQFRGSTAVIYRPEHERRQGYSFHIRSETFFGKVILVSRGALVNGFIDDGRSEWPISPSLPRTNSLRIKNPSDRAT